MRKVRAKASRPGLGKERQDSELDSGPSQKQTSFPAWSSPAAAISRPFPSPWHLHPPFSLPRPYRDASEGTPLPNTPPAPHRAPPKGLVQGETPVPAQGQAQVGLRRAHVCDSDPKMPRFSPRAPETWLEPSYGDPAPG